MSLVFELKLFWKKCGIREGDDLVLHCDLRRSFFKFKKEFKSFKIDDLLDSLIDIVLPNGTIAFPTFNFDFNTSSIYDYRNTPSRMGSLSELARRNKYFYRTTCPIYSYAIIGSKQKYFKKINNFSWYSEKSVFNYFKEKNFKIFIIDLEDNKSMTFLHYCEEFFKVNYRYYKNFSGYYIDINGHKDFRTYTGYVRKIEEGIVTNCNLAGEVLWNEGFYKGDRINQNSGSRYIYALDYFNFFKKYFELNKLENFFYKKMKFSQKSSIFI